MHNPDDHQMQRDKPIQISTTTTIERLALEHAADLFQLTDTNRTYLREWLPWLDAVNVPADTLRFIQRSVDQFDSGRGPNYALFYDQNLCGVAGFHTLDMAKKAGSIGYWLAEPYTGQGIMTEVVLAVLEIGFVDYDLATIEIACATENVRSRSIPERLDARLDRVVSDADWLYDHYVDHVVYVLEPPDFHAQVGES